MRLHFESDSEEAARARALGYGGLAAAAALLARQGKPSEADIEGSIANICRCGTYARIKQAIRVAAG